jgi:hypothetical protein
MTWPPCHIRATRVAISCAFLIAFRLVGRLLRGLPRLLDEGSQSLRDHLVTVAGGVLVDHRRPDAGVAEPRHQLFKRRARRCRKSAARVSQVVKVEIRQAHLFTRLAPDGFVEVRAAQLSALRPDED